MNYEEAKREMNKGNCVKREHWDGGSVNEYIIKRGGKKYIESQPYPTLTLRWKPTIGDKQSNNWVVARRETENVDESNFSS